MIITIRINKPLNVKPNLENSLKNDVQLNTTKERQNAIFMVGNIETYLQIKHNGGELVNEQLILVCQVVAIY